MSEFLSAAWIADLDRAVRAAPSIDASDDGSGDGAAFVIEQHVSTAAGDVCYHFVLDRAESRVVGGEAPAANLVILTDYDTAVGLMRGATNAQHAIADGRMKIRGDLHSIARRLDALVRLDDVFAAIRASTTTASTTTASTTTASTTTASTTTAAATSPSGA